jgi:peptide subunit release factor 1 (eRF1)
MRYDEEKRFVEVVQPTEPLETYMARRDLAMKHAVPLEQWMAKHEI